MSDYDRWKLRSDRDDWAAQNHDLPDDDDRDEFSVVQFFEDGSHETVREGVSAEEAVAAAAHYCRSIGAQLGLVERVIISDSGDLCCFEWRRGEGVTFK